MPPTRSCLPQDLAKYTQKLQLPPEALSNLHMIYIHHKYSQEKKELKKIEAVKPLDSSVISLCLSAIPKLNLRQNFLTEAKSLEFLDMIKSV